jgi:Flp pilus assembly protein TadG
MLPPMHDDSTLQAARDDIEPASTRSATRERRRKSRGQSLVEFAVLLPALVLILALAADFGRALTAYIAISGAAREGAAYGMMSTIQANDTAGIQAAALADVPTIWGTAPTVNVAALSTDAQGYPKVTVTVDYTFETILPIPPIPNSVDLTRTVSMRVLN